MPIQEPAYLRISSPHHGAGSLFIVFAAVQLLIAMPAPRHERTHSGDRPAEHTCLLPLAYTLELSVGALLSGAQVSAHACILVRTQACAKFLGEHEDTVQEEMLKQVTKQPQTRNLSPLSSPLPPLSSPL